MWQFTRRTRISIAIFLLVSLISIKYYIHQDQNSRKKMSQEHEVVSDHNEIDPYQHLHIIPNTNGTITRLQEFYPTVPPSPTNYCPSLSKDVPLNPERNTWVRIFLPPKAVNGSDPPAKLPIVIFVHGGGFILFSAASPVFHKLCSEMASQLGVLIVSVEYRLAPENRLPAAYDDVLDAMHWLKEGKDEWIEEHGNLSKCVLMGQSSGANIVYQAGLRALDLVNGLRPLTLRGLFLIQPFFGGICRVGSELRLVDDPFLPLVVSDLMWELSLPIGADRSHEFCDPTIDSASVKLGQVKELGWRVMVLGCDGDPLLDRQVEFVKMLETKGVTMSSSFSEGGRHGVFASDPIKKRELFALVENFLREL